MTHDARRRLRTFFLRLLLGPAILAGVALTWSAAWVGLTLPSAATCRGRPKLPTAKLRVRIAKDAATQYVIETASCLHDVDQLVAGKYLDPGTAKDPWGSKLEIRCPGVNDAAGADVSSPGPDRQSGTADDINSWDL